MKNKFYLPTLVLTLFIVSVAVFATEKADNNTAASVQPSAEPTSEKNAEQLAIVLAIEADTEYGAYLSGECLTCHVAAGVGGGDGSIPIIHAKTVEYLASALLEYKNQQRDNEVMRGVTAALTNEEIAALATYFSIQ